MLSITNFVLIDRLSLDARRGFTALTGETGAGKSIILDAIGVLFGGKADKRFVRAGADRAVITAEFALDRHNTTLELLRDHGVEIEPQSGLLVRRVIPREGAARAFVNDQPVSAGLLKSIGRDLIEIHGQHDGSELMRPSRHQGLLDACAGADRLTKRVRDAFRDWQAAKDALARLREDASDREVRLATLTGQIEELSDLACAVGEADQLARERLFLQNAQKVAEGLRDADQLIKDSDLDVVLSQALRALERGLKSIGAAEGGSGTALPAEVALGTVVEGIEKARIELIEAGYTLEQVMFEVCADPRRLDEVETRLFAIQAIARKFGRPPDELDEVLNGLQQEQAALEAGEVTLTEAMTAAETAREHYLKAARKLSQLRRSSAKRLSAAVEETCKGLKLDKLKFRVAQSEREEADWTSTGLDRIGFEIATNPGAPFGPLETIASGGELSRLSLAIKSALSARSGGRTLIFDEIDQGVGGAVAASIGTRLSELALDRQVFAITHSPQVAASAQQHWQVEKAGSRRSVTTRVTELSATDRKEEIARMLAGVEITEEARAAADRLLMAET